MDGDVHSDEILAAVLECADLGWHLFPCRVDKRPYTRRGFLDPTESKSSGYNKSV